MTKLVKDKMANEPSPYLTSYVISNLLRHTIQASKHVISQYVIPFPHLPLLTQLLSISLFWGEIPPTAHGACARIQPPQFFNSLYRTLPFFVPFWTTLASSDPPLYCPHQHFIYTTYLAHHSNNYTNSTCHLHK